MVALGGMGSLAGAVAGTVLLTLLPYADAIIPGLPRATVEILQDWTNDIYGLVLILVMLFMPRGLAGWVKSLVTRIGDRGRTGSASREGGQA
jgi:branched-chain amino acid transport system permease protein